MKERAVLDAQPEWNSKFQGWSAKFIAKNMWRVEGDGDHDPREKFKSLMADAYLTFRHVLASYPLTTDPKHIMALYQTAMINEFHDRAKEYSLKRTTEISMETVLNEDLKLLDTLGESNNEGLLRIILSELPPEIRAVLEVFNDEDKLALLRQPKTQSTLAKLAGLPIKRETLNDILCKIIKLPKPVDLLAQLQHALDIK